MTEQEEKRRIYVASSWRNEYQPEIVKLLRLEGHEVYDFRNPAEKDFGFSWTEVGLDYHPVVSGEAWKKALQHPIAQKGFNNDFSGMKWADICVLVLPCGRSAHTEAGWMAGQGKKVFALVIEDSEPDLMYKIFDGMATSFDELKTMLDSIGPRVESPQEQPAELSGEMLTSINGHERLTKEQKRSVLYFMESNFPSAPNGIYAKFNETFPDYEVKESPVTEIETKVRFYLNNVSDKEVKAGDPYSQGLCDAYETVLELLNSSPVIGR